MEAIACILGHSMSNIAIVCRTADDVNSGSLSLHGGDGPFSLHGLNAVMVSDRSRGTSPAHGFDAAQLGLDRVRTIDAESAGDLRAQNEDVSRPNCCSAS